ncbi:MAG: transcriptional repressor [Firmicutes bacterium]|nr:transcriptional repressor [Bacillota bacterium]
MKQPTGGLVERLKDNGLKLTPQRHLICQLIETLPGHPTAEDLYEQATAVMPSMSLKTVYSTLYELAGMGAIRLVNVGTGGFRVESHLEPHAHLVCRSCGQVTDVPVDPVADADLSVLEQFDFVVEQREVIFRGLCRECGLRLSGEGSGS